MQVQLPKCFLYYEIFSKHSAKFFYIFVLNVTPGLFRQKAIIARDLWDLPFLHKEHKSRRGNSSKIATGDTKHLQCYYVQRSRYLLTYYWAVQSTTSSLSTHTRVNSPETSLLLYTDQCAKIETILYKQCILRNPFKMVVVKI